MAAPGNKSKPGLTDIESRLEDYDFIRFTTVALNGITRAKLVPAKRALGYIKDGIYMFSGMNILGANSQVLMPPEVNAIHGGNALWKPDVSTFHHVSWLDDERYKIGQVLMEPCAVDFPAISSTAPRTIARQQIERLEGLGYEILSGMEWEYVLCNKETKLPISTVHPDFHHSLLLAEFNSWFCDVGTKLNEAGIEVDTMQTETFCGQFEFNSAPEYGIKSADGNVIMKQGIKEMATLQGFEANFMAKMTSEPGACGAHFNFSIWDKNTGTNAFYDESGQNKLSSMAQHWIGGIIKHSLALTALCCPTTNCYQRLHLPWVPSKNYWGMNNRFALLRVKNFSEKGTLMENRLPSPLANPYIVMAATLAAGMDGVINKLPCPKPEDEAATGLPNSLEEALHALEADTTMVEALGKNFIDWFIMLKKEDDLKEMAGIIDEEARYEAQQRFYGRTC